jgi:hypothetical protein
MIGLFQGGQGNKGRYRTDLSFVHRMREARSESVPERRSPGRISVTAGVKILEGSAAKVKARGLFEDPTGQAPLGIWRAWKAGAYLPLPSVSVFTGRRVRFGAYGDPTHLPLSLALAIAGASSGWTGYTHQWRKPSLQGWKQLLMASVDTAAELVIARSMGWSTFRVTPDLDHWTFETLCASDRAGTPCADCLACAGARSWIRSVFIPAHGTGARHFIESVA